MIDINLLRKNPEFVVKQLETRKCPQSFLDIAKFMALDAERKKLQIRTEQLQNKANKLNKAIGAIKRGQKLTVKVFHES